MDVVIRSLLVFVVLWFALRVSGKREISQLSAFELILLVTMGDLIGQTVMQEDTSLIAGLLAVATFVLLSALLSFLSWRFPRTRRLLEGGPTIVVRDGRVDDEAMAAEQLPLDDLLAAAREHGIRDLAQADLVVLEPDGGFSFFTREAGGNSGSDVDAGRGGGGGAGIA